MTLKMSKTKSKTSLADQIAALNNPASSFDPEDASDTETRAQLDDFDDEVDEADIEVHPSKLRKKNLKLLADDDKRYAGQATSRKNLDTWEDGVIHKNGEESTQSSDEEMYAHSDDAVSEDEEPDTDDERTTESIRDRFRRIQNQMEEASSESEENERSDGDEEDVADDDIDDDDDDDDDEDGEEYLGNEETESGVKAFSEVSIAEEVAKGSATKTQLTLWDAFMEGRIKVQKALTIANQLPSHDKQPAFIESGGSVVQEALRSSSQQLRKLLKKLIDLQQALLLGNQSTRHIVEGKQQKDEDSDEDVMSSDDDDDDDDADAPRKQSQKPEAAGQLKRKADVKDIEGFLAKRHKDFEGFQNDTIQKWHDKTKLATSKQSSKSFSSFEKSAVSQIQQVLQDKPRLIRRTQLRRTVYRRLGDNEDTQDVAQAKEETEETGASVNSHLKHYDEETFDDDDFYHQLLRELIEKRTSSTSDPVQLTRQWLEVQKLRRKIKKKVDTKASKGRKIRYDVHPQLVSFMPARESGRMMDEARNELFSSLFGKRRKADENVQ